MLVVLKLRSLSTRIKGMKVSAVTTITLEIMDIQTDLDNDRVVQTNCLLYFIWDYGL